jgi:hypothetical protein
MLASTTSPGYDLVLLAHVLTAVVGLGALVVAAGSALALRGVLLRGGPVPGALDRYYQPGVNWAGRVLFLVPVLGVALQAMSGGQWTFSDLWVSLGTAVWAVVAIAAEVLLWPEERRLQEVVATVSRDYGTPEPDDASGGATLGGVDGRVDVARAPGLCASVGLLGLTLGAALVVTGVVMVAKP